MGNMLTQTNPGSEMSTAPHTTRWAQRLGQTCARVVNSWTRLERTAAGYLVRQGVTPALVKVVLLIPKLLVLGVLLYVAFWVAQVVVLAAVGIVLISNLRAPSPSDEGEWRGGLQGHGYYVDGKRVDSGRLFEDDKE